MNEIVPEKTATKQELLNALTAIKNGRRAMAIASEWEVVSLTGAERHQIIMALKNDFGMSDGDIAAATMWG